MDLLTESINVQENRVLNRLYAAAAAKSLQSCLTLCDPIDGSPRSEERRVGKEC